MPNYLITLTVDEKWLEALQKFTQDVYEGETLTWHNVEEIE